MQKKIKQAIVVWATRHAPTESQASWWHERGFDLVRLEGDQLKFTSGAHAWETILAANGGVAPDVVVGVMPLAMLPDYMRSCGDVPLVRADMAAVSRSSEGGAPPTYEWQGTWTRTVRVEILTEPFELPAG